MFTRVLNSLGKAMKASTQLFNSRSLSYVLDTISFPLVSVAFAITP